MDAILQPEARGGQEIFINAIGDVQSLGSGDEDEDVDIDDEDLDAVPGNEGRHGNDTIQGPALTGISASDVGGRATRNGEAVANLEATSSGHDLRGGHQHVRLLNDGNGDLQKEVVAGVSRSQSQRQRGQHAAESQASIGQSHQSLHVGRSLSEENVDIGEDSVEPLGNLQESTPKGGLERNLLKRQRAIDFRKHLSAKFGIKGAPSQSRGSVGLSHSHSQETSVDKSDGDGDASREKETQTTSKRKALEIEPSTSTRVKRGKLNADFIPWSAMEPQRKKAEDVKSRDAAPAKRKGESPSKRKERLKDKGSEGREKIQRAGKDREKHPRTLILDDDIDEDEPEQEELQWKASRKSNGKGKKVSGVKSPPQGSGKKKGSTVDSPGSDKGTESVEKQVLEEQQQLSAGENVNVSFRSKFGTKAKKKGASHVSSDKKSQAVAGNSAQAADENTPFKWITCTECKKERKVPGDAKLKKQFWRCQDNIWDPKHSSCSLSQECNVPAITEEVMADKDGSERAQPEVSLKADQKDGNHNALAHLNLVWLKADEEEFWWPGKIVTEAEVPPDFHEKLKLSEGGKKIVVSLFYPTKDLEPFQVVKRSFMRPFKQFYESFKNINPDPDFKRAVNNAYRLFCLHSQAVKESSAQHTTGAHEGARYTVENHGSRVEETPAEEAQSNEFEVEDVQMPEDDTQGGQSQADVDMEKPEDDEVVQDAAEEKRTSKDTSEPTDNSGASERREEVSNHVTGEKEEPEDIHLKTGVSGDGEASERTKVSEPFHTDEPVSMEKLVVDLEISPTKRLIAYDLYTRELHFQDGGVVKIDAESLGRAFNKNSMGLTLHQCIYEAGRDNIRKSFPKRAKSSNGLDFEALDQTGDFAKRLRDTWAREFKDDAMPKLLKTRFVAGCILEERGEAVNWAAELTRDITLELKDISMEKRSELSPAVHKLITCVLEKQNLTSGHISKTCTAATEVGSPQEGNAAIPEVPENVTREGAVDLTEYNHFCQRCSYGGELLCCDGRDCRNTYHLKCLDPPLDEVPTTAFFCPSCSVDTFRSTLAESKVPAAGDGAGDLEQPDHVSRHEPEKAAGLPTLVEMTKTNETPVAADPMTAIEEDVIIKEVVHEISNAKIREEMSTSRQINEIQSGELVLHTKEPPVSKEPLKVHLGVNPPGSIKGDAAANSKNVTSVPTSEQTAHSNDHGGPRKESHTGQVGSSPPYVPSRASGATFSPIQLVNRDERSGSRAETNLLWGFTDSGLLPAQPVIDVESEVEDGEIAPQSQPFGTAEAKDLNTSVEKPASSPKHRLSLGVQLPDEDEGEFPSSDDHNSFCEGCEVGGELMLCDGKGCRVVYHKECLNPPLRAVPAGEWYCPQCELKRKGNVVEKIWAVREADSAIAANESTKLKGRLENINSNASSPENLQEDPCDSDDETFGRLEDMPLNARFKRTQSFQPELEVGDSELPGGSAVAGAMSASPNLKDGGLEYLVQWKSRSHAHNKWVVEKDLEKLAPKELARFKKMLTQGQVEKWNPEWAQPERVIQKRLTTIPPRQPAAEEKMDSAPWSQINGVEWYVKWKGLGYEHCTWEPAETGVLATFRAAKLFRAYEEWAEAAKQRATRESQEEAEKLSKAPIKNLESQPESMIRGELLPMQLDALNQIRGWWHARKNGILVYEASQEKIVTTIIFFLSLVEEFRVVHPILVVVPISLIQNWQHELHLWAPKLNIVNYASKMEEARDIVRRTEFNCFSEPFKPQLVLTTFEVINCDMDHLRKLEWEALIIDEGRRQRLLKTYRPFSQIKSLFRLLLLSEPLKSNVEELSQFVSFLEPRKSLLVHGDESTQVTELRRRLSGRVCEYIPINRLTEYWVPVEMTSVHLKQYYDILVMHYPTLSRNRREHQIQEVVTKLRQSCNHPFLADPMLEGTMGQGLTPKELLDAHIQISGKMQLVHMMMPVLKSAGWRVLIFSQENRQLDILERYMTQSHGSDSYERVDSDLAVKGKEAAIQRFNAEGSKRFVLLLKTGIHISFKNVQLVIIYDSDWNPANDMRALHKIHNEGEAGSKPLPVLRLYTHLTVEESTLILSRDKQMPPTRANVSAKVCQKLLTWGASKIFELHDKDAGSAGLSQRPKGAKIGPKAKTRRVVYDPEKVQKLLEGALCQEDSTKLDGDELLEAILIPREETAPLFAESDHPINMVAGISAETFWASFLKWRHEEWQAKEVNMLGKGQRGRKRVTYDEDAMASAAFTKAQMADDSERKRTRPRRRSSSEEEQETAPGREVGLYPAASESIPQSNFSPPSTPTVNIQVTVSATVLSTPSTSHIDTQVMVMDTILPSTVPSREEPQVDTNRRQPQSARVSNTANEPIERGEHGSISQVAGPDVTCEPRGKMVQPVAPPVLPPPAIPVSVGVSTRGATEEEDNAGFRRPERSKATTYSELMREVLANICLSLKLPESVEQRVQELFKHIMQTSKNLRKPREKHEFIAIELAVIWLAGDQLQYPIDKSTSIDKVEAALNVHYDNRPQLEGPLFRKVRELCSNFKEHPSPAVVPPATPQPASVPQPSTPNSTAPDLPPRTEPQPSPRSMPAQALIEQEPMNAVSQTLLPSTPKAGHQAELSTATPVPPSSALPSVQVAPATVVAQVSEAAQAAELEPEIEFVEADPHLVLEGSVDTLVPQNRLSSPQGPATLTSSTSTVEQGLGWVIQGAVLHVHAGEEQEAVFEVVTPAVEVSAPGQVPVAAVVVEEETPQAHPDPPQTHQADIVSPIAAVPGAYSSQSPATLPSQTPVVPPSPLTQTQVVAIDDVLSSRATGQASADIRAQMAAKLREDRAYVIRGQTKEIELTTQRLDKDIKELKDQFDKACLKLRRTHTSPGPFIDSQKDLYDIDMRALTRRAQQERKAMDTRQRTDRDKLTDLYKRSTSQVERAGTLPPESSDIESEIKTLREFYSQFFTLSPIQSPPEEPLSYRGSHNRRSVASQLPGPSASEALPPSRGQANGQARVAQGVATARSAEIQQRQHTVRAPTSTTPPSTSLPQQQRPHMVQCGPGQSVSHIADGQRPSAVPVTMMPQVSVQPPPVQPQRSLPAVQTAPRGAPPVSRGSFAMPTGVSTVPPAVASVSRAPMPTSAGPPAGNAPGPGYVYPDVLLKEKDKLAKELEKAKSTYESEAQRIKAEYDKEAELLHRKYEDLLEEEHRAFTKKQQQVQQNIIKVEWNRQLAEALKLREELASRAGILAGQPPTTAMQAPYYQPVPQQASVRPMSGGTTMTPAHVNPLRGAPYTSNSCLPPGSHSMTAQSLGMPSARAPLHQPPPRYGMPSVSQSEQARPPPLRSAHAALTEVVSRSIGLPGISVAGTTMVHSSREQPVQQPSISRCPPDTTIDATWSPQPQTTGTSPRLSVPSVAASAPSFADPILSIIRNSVPTVSHVAELSSSIPREASTATPMASASAGANSFSPRVSAPSSIPVAETQNQTPEQRITADVVPQISPRADASTAPAANEALTAQAGSFSAAGTQEQAASALARVRPASIIYLSDSDED